MRQRLTSPRNEDIEAGIEMDLTREIGEALRHARIDRGLTLRAAATTSGGRFKPSSIAGYERGERAITLQRFCDLAALYGTDASWLLDGILSQAGRRSDDDVGVDVAIQISPDDAPMQTGEPGTGRDVLDLREASQGALSAPTSPSS